MDYKNDIRTQKTALLVTCATILQLAESFFPQPLPGIKLGLANMITIVALSDLGFAAAVEIAVLRTVIGSLLLGTFLSTTFFLSFSSAITSSVVMGAVFTAVRNMKKPFISIIGISLIGAVVHNLTQITIVYFLLIKSPGVLMLLPWLGISGVAMGWMTGIIASRVCMKLGGEKSVAAAGYAMQGQAAGPSAAGLKFNGRYLEGSSFLHIMDPAFKIITVAAVAVIVLAANNVMAYLLILEALLLAAAAAGVKFSTLFSGVKKMKFFLLFSFVVPMLFGSGGAVLLSIGSFKLTSGGIETGMLFVFRLLLLMISTDLLIRTSKPEALVSGIEKLLAPLKFAGISGKRTSHIIVTSWMSVPDFWDRAMVLVKKYREGGKAGLKNAVVILVAVIVNLYRQAEI
jgi:heptaprenyl diphosphate synthase